MLSETELRKERQTLATICALLKKLGIDQSYRGFAHMAYAIYLSLQDEERLFLVTKLLYPDVAKYFGTTKDAVERNIRNAIIKSWEKDPTPIMKLSGNTLTNRPTNAHFLFLATTFMTRAKQKSSYQSAVPAKRSV